MPKDIFNQVNDKGGDDHWRNKPSDDGAMFTKSRDVGEKDHPQGKLMDKRGKGD